MQLFAKVGYVGAVDVHANFRSIDTALLALLRFATGEARRRPSSQTDRQTDRRTDGQTDRQADRQTDR